MSTEPTRDELVERALRFAGDMDLFEQVFVTDISHTGKGDIVRALVARLQRAEEVCEAADEYCGNLGQQHYWRCENLKPGPNFCVCGGNKTWAALEAWRALAKGRE